MFGVFFALGAFALVSPPAQGVVRSFHQWRAEMQCGNTKRHLGFFERCESTFKSAIIKVAAAGAMSGGAPSCVVIDSGVTTTSPRP